MPKEVYIIWKNNGDQCYCSVPKDSLEEILKLGSSIGYSPRESKLNSKEKKSFVKIELNDLIAKWDAEIDRLTKEGIDLSRYKWDRPEDPDYLHSARSPLRPSFSPVSAISDLSTISETSTRRKLSFEDADISEEETTPFISLEDTMEPPRGSPSKSKEELKTIIIESHKKVKSKDFEQVAEKLAMMRSLWDQKKDLLLNQADLQKMKWMKYQLEFIQSIIYANDLEEVIDRTDHYVNHNLSVGLFMGWDQVKSQKEKEKQNLFGWNEEEMASLQEAKRLKKELKVLAKMVDQTSFKKESYSPDKGGFRKGELGTPSNPRTANDLSSKQIDARRGKKCNACSQEGHFATDKWCPRYGGSK